MSILHEIQWNRVVFDEAHHLRNKGTGKHDGSHLLKTDIIWFISGTPIQNRRKDFYHLCSILKIPSSDYTNLEIIPFIIERFMLRRTKKEVGVECGDLDVTKCDVDWKAENELSVEKYIVERSANGINFEAIGSTNAIGNSGATIDYRFFDALPLNGNNYYRIKSIDKSGAFRYTNIVVLNLNTLITGIKVYPNPITTGSFMLMLQGMAAGQYGIQLFTNQGQQILFKEIKHLGGSTTIKLNLPAGLSAGMYFIRYTKNNVVLKSEQLMIE
jgi:hypothetical protein